MRGSCLQKVAALGRAGILQLGYVMVVAISCLSDPEVWEDCVFFFAILGIEPKVSLKLGKHCTIKLLPSL